jgi:signal transduction histidine kinase
VTTSYAAVSGGATAADLMAGVGLLVAGTAAALARPGDSIAVLTIAAGAIWLAGDWVGWEGGWPLARSIGMLAAPLLLPVLLHLALALPWGRVPPGSARLAIVIVYGLAAAYALARALAYDPFLDPECWSNCTDNVLAVAADQPFVDALEAVWRGALIGLGLALAALALWRLTGSTPLGRASLWGVLIPLAVAGGAASAYSVALLTEPIENPNDSTFMTIFVIGAAALTCLALGIAWNLIGTWRKRHAVGRLAVELGAAPAPGSLRSALARSLGDDDLEVAYWIASEGRYVDAAGAPVDPRPAAPGRAATAITRGGEPLAMVLHDRALYGGEALEREIGSAARLAVDNERLRAQVLAQLVDLRAARARIVETGDRERTRLERDLHDGAQQQLLALSYDARLARTTAEGEEDHESAELLADAVDEVQSALADLRELADGIYPAILIDAGLAAALETFAESSPVALEQEDTPDRRYPAPVEIAAYLVVTEAAAEAARRGAPWLRVRFEQADGTLAVELEGAGGAGGPAPPLHLVDRVGALGGRVLQGAAGPRVEIPCE